jgi:hypothetical protein
MASNTQKRKKIKKNKAKPNKANLKADAKARRRIEILKQLAAGSRRYPKAFQALTDPFIKGNIASVEVR